jgi:hypothetical protein
MKRTTLMAGVALAALFSSGVQANIVDYKLTGNDGIGDSFSITLQYNNITDQFTSATAGSFTDATGSYTGITTPSFISVAIAPGVEGFQFSNSGIFDAYGAITFNYNTTSIPTLNNTLGWEAATYSSILSGGTVTYYSTADLDPVSVPEPSAIAILSAGLLGWAAAARRKKPQA